MSPSDNLKTLQAKMTEYMEEPGVKLGWLIDRKQQQSLYLSPKFAYRILRKS